MSENKDIRELFDEFLTDKLQGLIDKSLDELRTRKWSEYAVFNNKWSDMFSLGSLPKSV